MLKFKTTYHISSYVMATIWYSDPEYSNPYSVTLTKALEENDTYFFEWALYDT